MNSENNDSNSDIDTTGSPFDRQMARIAVGGYFDAQDVRKSAYNRVRDVVRKKREGIPFDEVEDEKDDDERSWESEYEDDVLPDLIDQMLSAGQLTDREHQYISVMLAAAETASEAENRFKSVMAITDSEPIYTGWLEHVQGVSTTLTAQLIHKYGYCGPVTVTKVDTGEVVFDERRDGFDAAVDEFNNAVAFNQRAREKDGEEPYKLTGSPRVSNLWSYSGLAPGQEPKRGERLGYDPEAKTLLWKVADCMVKRGEHSEYRRRFYDPYKAKQLDRMEAVEDTPYVVLNVEENGQTTPATFEVDQDLKRRFENDEVEASEVRLRGEMLFKGTPPKSQGHADTRSRRYLAKKFLKHYWAIARDMQGLETPAEWVLAHGGHDERKDTFENPFYARKVVVGR